MLPALLGLPGYPEAWSSTALWLPGGLVSLLDSPAAQAVVSTGACWLLGCLISLLERLSASQSGSSGCLAPQQFRGFLFFAVWPLGQCGLLGLPACRLVPPPPLRQSGHPDWLVWRGCLGARWPSVSHQFGRLVSLVPAFSRRAGRKIPPDSHMRGTRR